MIRRDDLLVGPKEKAIEAIKAGREQEAIKHIEELSEEFRPLHDRYGEWIQSLLCFIAEKLGEEAVEEALQKTFIDVYKDIYESTKDLSPEELIKSRCKSHRTHYSDFYVEEDDEKFVLVIPYCGSGGRMQKKDKAYGRTKKAYPWSFNQAGVSYYCAHELVFSKLAKDFGLDRFQYEYHHQFDNEGKPTGLPCRWIIYKKKPKP